MDQYLRLGCKYCALIQLTECVCIAALAENIEQQFAALSTVKILLSVNGDSTHASAENIAVLGVKYIYHQ